MNLKMIISSKRGAGGILRTLKAYSPADQPTVRWVHDRTAVLRLDEESKLLVEFPHLEEASRSLLVAGLAEGELGVRCVVDERVWLVACVSKLKRS